jgi:hypothetical protein
VPEPPDDPVEAFKAQLAYRRMPQRLRRRVREMAGTKFGVCVAASRSTPLAPGVDTVRLPGERGLARKRQARAAGIRLYPEIMDALTPWAERFELVPPAPVA